MKLEEALSLSIPSQYLARNAWIRDGVITKLFSSTKTLKEIRLGLELNDEEWNADDWNIFDLQD